MRWRAPARSRAARACRLALLAGALMAMTLVPSGVRASGDVVDEVHYTFTGTASVTFDWRGAATDIRFGKTTSYGTTANAQAPSPTPFSSAGPFQEVRLAGLDPGTTYHYSIGGGVDHTFTTAPTGDFRFDAEADIGSSRDFSNVAPTQAQISADNPAFVLAVGDLTYGEPQGQASVDQHFNDVMAWSLQAAYMPAWGNHEWEDPASDDLRNYKGRFELPNPGTSSSAPAAGCCGEDWSSFDAGGVRFISYPEPYSSGTWSEWKQQADPIFAAAQADPSIHFIVTFGHRPAYSTGFHPGDTTLAGVLNGFGDQYSKYVLNINGHSHDYERFQPIHGVTHITTGGGGSSLETPWSSSDPRTAFRTFHLEHLRVDVSSTGMRIDAICGPPTVRDDTTCVQGSVLDSHTIGINPPPAPPPPSTLYVAKNDPNCSDVGSGTAAQPFCSIKPAASRVVAGQTVLVSTGTYNEGVTVSSSGTASAPIIFAAAPGADPVVTGASDGFYINGRSYVTVQGFDVTGTTADGVVVKNSSNVTLRGNHVSSAGQPAQGKNAKGIRLDNATDSVVSTNTVDHNTDYGIYLLSGSTRNQIVGNRVFSNARVFERAASGIRLYASPGNTVASNVSHDNEDSGLEFYTGSNNNLVFDNVAYGNGDHGIDDYSSTGQRVLANTIYNNLTAGINFEGSSTGALASNNISVDNGIDSPRTKSNIRVDSTSTSGTVVDYDLVNLRTAGVMAVWGNTSYSSLAAFASATGQERHGIQADPLWQAPASADFHLKPGSPAIDSANAGASGQPATDADGNPRVDDLSVPNTGAGSRTYDDRGAYEFQPEEPTDGPPSATLTVNTSSGTAPLQVTADASESTDADTTGIASYTFDFGDGTVKGPQPGATATHTYTSAGTFTVKVTVTDTAGLASSSTTQVTVRDAPPNAKLSVNPSSGTAPLQVSADASASTDNDSTPIATYKFDFGDGSAAVGPQAGGTAAHTYTATGTYTVTATATDTAGNSSSAATQVTVNAPADDPPNPALSVQPSSGLAPLSVSADASASTDTDATPIATYKIDFGDGSAAVGPQASSTAVHTYIFPGTYTATVTVADTARNSSTATTQVTVTEGDAPPAAALSANPSSGTAPLQVSADASGSTDNDSTPIATYKFDFGDGSAAVGPQAGATAAHTYAVAGTYTLTVTVSDTAGNASTATTQVTVSAPPDAPPNATVGVSPSSGTAPLQVAADASASTDTDATPIATYKFDFGDGSTAVGPQAGASAPHTYTAAGTYTVTVTATDTAGNASSATTQVAVNRPDLPPAAAVAVTPASGLVPLAVTADASGSTDTDDTPIASYKFSFGDGSAAVGPQTGATASHTYSAAGTYTVTATVTDAAGKSSIATAQVTAFANLVKNPGFETDLSGWNTSGSDPGISLTRVSGGHSGSWSAQLSNTSATAATCVLNDSPDWAKPTAKGTYTGTLWARADAPGTSLKLRFREYVGSTLTGTATTTVTLTSAWQQVSVTYVPSAPGSSTLDFNAYVSKAAPGVCFYADDASIYLVP
jgi:parallel beta-helix repeat protein